jgi:hypothetical protein
MSRRRRVRRAMRGSSTATFRGWSSTGACSRRRGPGVPLLERVRFLTIFTSNLDEFFMKRVGLVKRQVHAGIDVAAPTA